MLFSLTSFTSTVSVLSKGHEYHTRQWRAQVILLCPLGERIACLLEGGLSHRWFLASKVSERPHFPDFHIVVTRQVETAAKRACVMTTRVAYRVSR